MKTAVRTTSVLAYYGIQADLNRREAELLDVLHEIQPACDREIANALHWEIGSVNGRRNSLVEKKVIIAAYTGISTTGRRVIYWKINAPAVQSQLF